jgi:NADH:ubiquinone oxidoreductase subunit
MVYRVSSRTARATQRNPVSKNKNNNNNNNKIGMVVYNFNSRQVDLCEFKDILAYSVSSRPARQDLV